MKTKTKEPKRILNVAPSIVSPNDWGVAEATASGGLPFGKGGNPPEAFSWIKPFWKVQDQGKSGACVGFSVAYGLLWAQLVAAGRIDPKEMPSAKFIWMAAKETDAVTHRPSSFVDLSGTTLKAACKIAVKFGCPTEKDLSMKPAICKLSENKLYAKATRMKAKSYIKLDNDPETWKKWIANVGPVLVRLSPDHQFMQSRSRKVMDNYIPQPLNYNGHAVVLAGYSPSVFLIRNSWGRQWKMRGYGTCTHKYADDAIQESYGVIV